MDKSIVSCVSGLENLSGMTKEMLRLLGQLNCVTNRVLCELVEVNMVSEVWDDNAEGSLLERMDLIISRTGILLERIKRVWSSIGEN